MSNILQNLSDELAATVDAVSPAIVRVEARRRLPASGILWAADGVIVTAHHVVQREKDIFVGLHDGSKVSATLAGRDPSTDLAVLRINERGLTPAPLALESISQLKVGHLVLAMGRPGKSVQATLGVVSAFGQGWRTPGGTRLDYYLQTDVVMYPGFSGGPLVSAGGEIVGLNSSALLRGVSLAVPATSIKRVVETLLAHGEIKRGYLGVSTQPVRLPAALSQQLEQETGLLLIAVETDSPADNGGLVLGDTIVELNSNPVKQHDDLLAQLGGDKIGQPVKLKIVRGGQVQDISVTVGER
jgi:S1-C subfamily serine protease